MGENLVGHDEARNVSFYESSLLFLDTQDMIPRRYSIHAEVECRGTASGQGDAQSPLGNAQATDLSRHVQRTL